MAGTFSNIGSVEGSVAATTTTSDTVSVAVPSLGTERVGFVLVGASIAGRTIGTPTWDGVSMTAGGAEVLNGSLRIRTFYLTGCAHNGTYNVVIPYDGGTAVSHSSHYTIGWADSDGAISFTDYDTTSGTTQNPQISTTAAGSGDLILSCAFSLANDLGSPVVSGATELQSIDFGGSCVSSAYSQASAAGSVTHTHNFGASDVYAIAAMALTSAGVSNTAPTIAANTADATEFTDTTPAIEFTGSDTDGDGLRYNIRITDHPSDHSVSGSTVVTSFVSGGAGLSVHPQNAGVGDAWDGNPQMDDRPGMSFKGGGGILDKTTWFCQADSPNVPSGYAFERIYAHAGTYGTSSAPADAAARADTPTPGWLAQSDNVTMTGLASGSITQVEFAYSGADRIRLDYDAPYVRILQFVPDSTSLTNTFAVSGDAANSGSLFAGNAYNDGAASGADNNGPQVDWDFYGRVFEVFTPLDKVSGTDAGFANTVTPADTDPFNAGEKVSYTPQSALAVGAYIWDVRVTDPSGSGTYSSRTASRTFTIVESTPSDPSTGSPVPPFAWADASFLS